MGAGTEESNERGAPAQQAGEASDRVRRRAIVKGDRERALDFLAALERAREKYSDAVIYHSNDVDGLSCAVLAWSLLERTGFTVRIDNVAPMTPLEVRDLEPPEGRLALILNLPLEMYTENVFKIARDGDMELYDPRTFLRLHDSASELPMSTASLVAYIRYVQTGGELEFEEFVKTDSWRMDERTRWLVILGCIATSMDQLTPTSTSNLLRRWIRDLGFPEEDMVLYSVGVSLFLGRGDRPLAKVMPLFLWDGRSSMEAILDEICKSVALETANLWMFAKSLDREIHRHIRDIRRGLEAQIESQRVQYENLTARLRSMKPPEPLPPVDSKAANREMMDRVRKGGDAEDAARKEAEARYRAQLAYHNEETARIRAQMTSISERMESLQRWKMIKGLVVFLPQQSSTQVKGILASLFYFYGWRNIVIEDRGTDAVWGSRGFRRSALERHLASYTVDTELLDMYIDKEQFLKNIPDEHRKYLSPKQGIIFSKRYVGQIGGHGTIYGGSLEGYVPNLFALLDSSNFEQVLDDLIARGELAKALKGFTEAKTMIPTVKALKAKFKGLEWITIQVTTTNEGSGDILAGGIGVIGGWMMGEVMNITLHPAQ